MVLLMWIISVFFQASKKTDVCEDLKKNLNVELTEFKAAMEEAWNTFDECLREGVKKSKKSCEETLTNFFKHVCI